MNTLMKYFGFRLNCWTCTLLIFGAGLLALFATSSSADAAPSSNAEVQVCSPVKACELTERSYIGCSKNKSDDCVRFVRHFTELSSYNCNKTTLLEAKTASVPAIQLCDAHKDFTLARYTELLSSLASPEAHKLFASEKFRSAIQKTAVAEDYLDRSKEMQTSEEKK